jgi:hypothetical protein
MRRLPVKYVLGLLWIAVCGTASAQSTTLFDQTDAVGLPTVAPPSQYSFTAATAQALTVTLTDFKFPAAFQKLQIGVTLGDTLVGSATVDATGTAVVAVPAAAGTYGLRVIGTPDATAGLGNFGVCVAPANDNTACIAADSFSQTLITPATSTSTSLTSVLQASFTSTLSGTYTVNITDDVFPVALQTSTVSGGIAQGSTPVNSAPFTIGQNQITLAAGTVYTLIIGATADPTATAGLYAVHITDPSGAAVFDRTTPVGTLAAPTTVSNPAAQSLTLTATDFQYPSALTSLGVAVTAGSTDLGALTAPGTLPNIVAPSGTLDVWVYTVAGAAQGVYGITLTGAGATTLLSSAQAVNPVSSTSTGSYAYVVTLPSAGNYQLTAADFAFPQALTSLSATIAQNGAVLAENSTGVFAAAAGPAVVLVNAVAPQSGNGVFDVNVATTDTPATQVFDQTQAVGGTFTTQPVTVSTAGGYTVTLADLGFPATFSNLAAVLSQGGTVLGKIFGSGNFPATLAAGTYELTFVATPGPSNYGVYSLNIAPAPAPTVTFTASAASVTVDQPVQLTWSTTNATACTASGAAAFAGSEAVSGTTSVVVSANLTLTLTCTGPGGSATQTVNVTAVPASSGGHGGGGALDGGCLLALGGIAGWGAFRRRRRAP